ncbi:hypothetical protein [Vibrio harveyi]|uniref:nSTAND3 domain-containing NTPase n=2 Tax=Vibrio harveyi group TaxID=717610 RepID=UPI0018F24FAA|nr:hypothetical protein [Vibrio harveyi]
MINYSFDSLNDKEFEEFINDLLTQHLGKRVIRYAPGRDLGIDGKVILDEEIVIVQSKHYIKSGFSSLLSSLEKEKVKIKRLNPHRYIVATSIDLTPANVEKIVEALYPFLKEEDIYFKSTINDLLKEYPNIEKQHYKLWLTSTNVLKHLLNNGVYNLSKFTLEEARKKLNKYTKTAAHDIAMRKLLEDKCAIITGEPGVGKTTLAQQMCNEIVSRGYHFFDIDHDIDDAFEAYEEEEKQIFYYDDFLGSNYLEAFENNKDSKIVKFINRISSSQDNKKLFILTSRASIFSQGVRKSDKFVNNHIESNKFVLNINGLTLFDKASILYNHIYHSQLDEKYKAEIYNKEFYLKIIKHRNFNPRLIEFITCHRRISHVDSDNYIEHINNSLDNPSQIWHHAFTEQLKELDRIIVYFVAFSNKKLNDKGVYSLVTEYCKYKNISLDDEDFNKSMHTITGSFILREVSRTGNSFRLFNPSIKDYLMARLENEEDLSKLIFITLNQPSTIEVAYPVSKFQRSISKRLVFSYKEYDLEKYHDLFLRCSTNTINYKDGIDNDLCLQLSKRVFEKLDLEPLSYSELVVISRNIGNNESFDFLISVYDFINFRAFMEISETTLMVLSKIIRIYKKVCAELKHKADSYYEDNIEYEEYEEYEYSSNKYRLRYDDINTKLKALIYKFENKAFDFWSKNYLTVSHKLNNNINSSDLFEELQDILTSYKVIPFENIEYFLDELELSDVDQILFEKKLHRKFNRNNKKPENKSDEIIKIRELFSTT